MAWSVCGVRICGPRWVGSRMRWTSLNITQDDRDAVTEPNSKDRHRLRLRRPWPSTGACNATRQCAFYSTRLTWLANEFYDMRLIVKMSLNRWLNNEISALRLSFMPGQCHPSRLALLLRLITASYTERSNMVNMLMLVSRLTYDSFVIRSHSNVMVITEDILKLDNTAGHRNPTLATVLVSYCWM